MACPAGPVPGDLRLATTAPAPPEFVGDRREEKGLWFFTGRCAGGSLLPGPTTRSRRRAVPGVPRWRAPRTARSPVLCVQEAVRYQGHRVDLPAPPPRPGARAGAQRPRRPRFTVGAWSRRGDLADRLMARAGRSPWGACSGDPARPDRAEGGEERHATTQGSYASMRPARTARRVRSATLWVATLAQRRAR